MITHIPYGRSSIPLDLRGFRLRALRPEYPKFEKDLADRVLDALKNPVEGPPLGELARKKHSALLILPDATRKAALPEILPPLIAELRNFGIRKIRILIACGTHPPAGPTALARLLGDLPPDIPVEEHDARDPGRLEIAGRLPGGRVIRLNRQVFESDLVLTIGAVRHHYFAGFGGGPKMIFPGVAGYEEIQENHSLVISFSDGRARRHPGCEPGRLSGNPVAEEIAEAADLRPPEMVICLLPGPGGSMGAVYAGPWRAAFSRAVEDVRGIFESRINSPFDLMIASGGGFPSDDTLIQAHKALDAACRFLRPGGSLLYCASMASGAGSRDMESFLQDPRPEAILTSLSRKWIQYGHTSLRILEKTSAFEVHLHSELDGELAPRLGFIPTPDIEDLLKQWRETSPHPTLGLMIDDAIYPAETLERC